MLVPEMTARRYGRPITVLLASAVTLAGCSARGPATNAPLLRIVPHAAWEAQPPLGHPADALRRNLRPGDRVEFHDLAIEIAATDVEPADAELAAAEERLGTAGTGDIVHLRLTRAGEYDQRRVAEGAAFNWQGYRVAVVAIHGPGELGEGLVALEIATVESLPADVAAADSAGGAALRLRVPHQITHVTLHHTGSREPLRRDEDPADRLRGLQEWGARDRNWWDVPYHMLIDLDGRIYEGRDWRYMGETNTTYDPRGHFLISVIGNYGRQEPTRAQIEAIADLMEWAVARFGVPIERISGHYDHAETSCPGEHLSRYLEDGTFRRMVQERLAGRWRGEAPRQGS